MNQQTIVALIQNAALLLSMAVVFDFITAKRDVLATRLRQTLAGIALGSIGMAMIGVSIAFESGILFDSRSVLLAVSGLFLGAWPTAIAILMTSAFRLAVGGSGAWVGVGIIVASGAIGVLWRHVRSGRLDRIAWQDLYVLGIVVHLVMIVMLVALPDGAGPRVLRSVGLPVILIYPVATLAVGKLFAERLRSHRARAETAQLLVEADASRRALLGLIEEQRATERKVVTAQRLSQSTLDALTQHICVVDEEGEILAVNDAWCEFAQANGARPEAVLAGANYLDVCRRVKGAESAEALHFAAAMEDVIGGVLDSFTMEYACHSPREQRWFAARITRFLAEGSIRLVVAHEDVTERKSSEHERLELITHLHQAEKLESLGGLAGGVAHDINNVLAAILSLASAQRKQTPDSAPFAASLDAIVNACLRGRSVVRSLLYFARNDIDSRGPVDLDAIAREIVQLLDQTTLKRIRFGTSLHGHLPRIDGDAGAISHAVMNVCVNAIDAMPEGGVIDVVTRRRPDGFVEIAVRDTGTGMTQEVIDKAVEPFFTTKAVGKGTGLGLAMVYGTVKAHRGTLEIESEPGRGTEVVLAFPATLPPAGEESAVTPEQEREKPRAMRLLLVDDDDLIREAIASLLEIEGHEVTLAEGGARALELLQSGLRFDLVILDMNMPGMDGGEALERILELRPGQPVIMCSGHGDEEINRLTHGRGNVVAIQKPFTLDELEAKIAPFGLRTG